MVSRPGASVAATLTDQHSHRTDPAMKKRHVFSTPSLEVARQVYRAAREQGIGSDCILLEARKDIEIHRIRDDRKNVGMDFLPAAMRGTLLGAIAGLAAGLITMNIPFF